MTATAPANPRSLDDLELNGFAILDGVVDDTTAQSLLNELRSLPNDAATRTRAGGPFARRNLLKIPAVRRLAVSASLRRIIEPVLGDRPQPVRAILFDKNAAANWLVPWHQDLSIAVKERRDVPGFGPWSTKAGVVHVQPPVDVLRRMVTLRLHLDDCDARNGPLKVVPGTHHSVLTPRELATAVERGPRVQCVVHAGGAVLMRPLLVHASSPAIELRHRRVIHIEYATVSLPGGLCWYER